MHVRLHNAENSLRIKLGNVQNFMPSTCHQPIAGNGSEKNALFL